MLTKTQKEQVLKFISAHTSKTFTFRDLVRSLDIGSDDRRSLDRHLDGLDKEGVIRRIKRNCYSVAAREDLVAGTVHCHRDGYGFLLPEDRRRYREDIFIPARNMEDALHEDRVLVKIEKKRMPPKRGHRARRRPTDDDRKRIEGRVVRVLERKKPVVVGRYCAHPRFPFVVPLDNRIPHNIRIPFEANRGAEDGSIVAVTLTLPPSGNQSPQGSITKVLGYPGDPDIEYRIVEHTHGLPVEFTPASLQEAQGIPNRVIRKECDGREDFREETIITIDNDTARDFDDAVGIRKLPSGNYILGVHIADVSHYVAEGSALDAEAFARGTSVYFPDRNIPMLPPRLSSGI
ncbi:MAG TPA: RNB domain-containing ribonuclease, partial [Acidobacteriota bacterium]|nr:RNB domain-containing ribonuclease [Acidobacteriota bacterium]